MPSAFQNSSNQHQQQTRRFNQHSRQAAAKQMADMQARIRENKPYPTQEQREAGLSGGVGARPRRPNWWTRCRRNWWRLWTPR
jgi:hypothetical protein